MLRDITPLTIGILPIYHWYTAYIPMVYGGYTK